MKVFFTKKFLNDLKKIKDIKIYHTLFSKLFQDNGEFVKHREDHRFKNIDDGWIRRLTSGKTAYRLIYIYKGDKVFLFRIGNHDIEDNLLFDTNLDQSIPVEDNFFSGSNKTKIDHFKDYSYADNSYLLFTKKEKKYSNEFLSIYHGSYKKIVLVSPFISDEILSQQHHFGRFLEKQISFEDTIIEIVTSVVTEKNRIDFFKNLETKDFKFYFKKDLHAKLFYFELDFEKTGNAKKVADSTFILGSANLTNEGLDLSRVGFSSNDEIGYKLPSYFQKDLEGYIYRLKADSYDINRIQRILRKI